MFGMISVQDWAYLLLWIYWKIILVMYSSLLQLDQNIDPTLEYTTIQDKIDTDLQGSPTSTTSESDTT